MSWYNVGCSSTLHGQYPDFPFRLKRSSAMTEEDTLFSIDKWVMCIRGKTCDRYFLSSSYVFLYCAASTFLVGTRKDPNPVFEGYASLNYSFKGEKGAYKGCLIIHNSPSIYLPMMGLGSIRGKGPSISFRDNIKVSKDTYHRVFCVAIFSPADHILEYSCSEAITL